ncbi:MAG: prephenate dehydrogenase, partial [Gaiellales bacterium]
AGRDPGGWHVTAWSRSPASLGRALDDGVLASAAEDPIAAARDADVVLLAASPPANVALVERVGPAVAERGALLTDVTGVQRPMAAAATAIPGLRFVGGHPMSGREARGYGAGTADLFVDRPWVVLRGERASDTDVALVRRLAEACGARPMELAPGLHDDAVALISHLPLVAAIALVEAVTAEPDGPLARALAAGGWRDMTRLARGDPELGAGMLALNAAADARALRRYRARLDAWQARLDELAATTTGPALAELREDLAAGARFAAAAPPEKS